MPQGRQPARTGLPGGANNTKLRYTHDAWNRLVKVEHVYTGSTPETVTTKAVYQYNGLFQRVHKQADSDTTPGLNEERRFYYSAGWQVLEEHIDDTWQVGQAADRIVQHVWGLRYIDDLVMSRQDSNANGDYDQKIDIVRYALTDHQFSVIAMMDENAVIQERVSYSPYGEARHHWLQDVDGDGDIDAADETAAGNADGFEIFEVGTGEYNVDADFNRDGIVDSLDTAMVTSTSYTGALAGGRLTPSGTSASNPGGIGYCGYMFNSEIPPGSAASGVGLYTVRFRHYDPAWGRWLQRDPAGYMDSMSLYGYGNGSPTSGTDPSGLSMMIPFGGGSGGGGGPRMNCWRASEGSVNTGSLQSPIGSTDSTVSGADKGGANGENPSTGDPGWSSPWTYDNDSFWEGWWDETFGSRTPHADAIPTPGDFYPEAIGRGDPRFDGWLKLKALIDPTRFVGAVTSNDFWDEFWPALGESIWEHRYDILLTLVPGSALLKITRLVTRGRCFWLVVCFTAGTQVWTAEGMQYIEDVEPGEWVWSWDDATGEVVLSQVLETYVTADQRVLDVVLLLEDGGFETISATEEHPFWVDGQGWTPTNRLDFGDELLQADGDTTLVWEVIPTDRLETVYNLNVSGTHTYFVGDDGVLVHNTCSGVRRAWKAEQALVRRGGAGSRDWTISEVDELLRTGRVRGYHGHHINSPRTHPLLRNDPTNIEFVTPAEHLLRHGGNWRNLPVPGMPIYR